MRKQEAPSLLNTRDLQIILGNTSLLPGLRGLGWSFFKSLVGGTDALRITSGALSRVCSPSVTEFEAIRADLTGLGKSTRDDLELPGSPKS